MRAAPSDACRLEVSACAEWVAADVYLLDGAVLLDQSMPTGESLPVEAGAGADTYAGAPVRRAKRRPG